MSRVRTIFAGLAALFSRTRRDAELDAELQAHLDLLAAENLRKGMTPDEARHAARREFGGVEQTKEIYREQRGLPFLDSVLQDLCFAGRLFVKTPGFTCITVLTLALGIGANTAIFSFVAGTLLRSFPYRDADHLVQLWSSEPERGWLRNIVSPGDFSDWKKESKSFEDMAGYIDITSNLSDGREAVVVPGLAATANFFSVLGMAPELGQAFRPGDDRPGAPRVALISHALWVWRFGADPNIVGKSIRLNMQSYTVLGVMPASFVLATDEGRAVKFWTPFEIDPAGGTRNYHTLLVIGRLRPGINLAQAQEEMKVLARRHEKEYPQSNAGWTVLAESLRESLAGDVRPILLILTGAVGCVLLIACVNVANLQLSRGVSRRREIAIRGALGASRLRLLRQLLVESTLLSLAAAALGVMVARWSIDLVLRSYFADDPSFDAVRLDGRVLLCTLILSVVTAFLSGLAPAFMTSGVDQDHTLKESGRSSGALGKTHRLRGILVAAECALAMVLLVGAGLLIRTFEAVTRINPGFDPHHVLTFHLSLAGPRYDDMDTRAAFYDRVLEKISALPGVEATSVVTSPPFLGYNGWDFVTEENPSPDPKEVPNASYQVIGPDYFRVLRIPLLRGRYFTLADQRGSAPVAMISESLARRYWPGQDPIGKHLQMGRLAKGPDWMAVVGVVGDVHRLGLDADFGPELYVSYRQHNWIVFPRACVVRTSSDPLLQTNAIRRAVAEIDPDQGIDSVRTMGQAIRMRSLRDRSFNMALFGILAGIALALAVVGIYSVMSYSVAERTQEIGIRVAFGADRSQVMRLFLRQGMYSVFIGLTLGLAGSIVLARFLRSLLFGVASSDPFTYAGVLMALIAVSLLACSIPVRRAMRVDPLVALRYE